MKYGPGPFDCLVGYHKPEVIIFCQRTTPCTYGVIVISSRVLYSVKTSDPIRWTRDPGRGATWRSLCWEEAFRLASCNKYITGTG